MNFIRTLYTQGPATAATVTTVPDYLMCPISQEMFIDPVTTILGYTYERAFIEEWFEKHDTDPLTNEKLSSKTLVPNRLIKSEVEHFKAVVSRGLL